MRSVSHIIVLTAIGLAILPHAVFGIWSAGGKGSNQEAPPDQVIVKLKPDVTLSAGYRAGQVVTGRPAWDRLHRAYRVTGQTRLLDKGHTATLCGPLGRLYVIRIGDGADAEAAARDYGALPEVEYAHPDCYVDLYDAPDDPLYPHQWYLHNTGQVYYHVERIDGDNNDTLALVSGTADADIDAGEVYDSPPDATHTVVVAIVDTGVDWDHPDLAGMMWNNPREIPANGLDDDHNGYIDDVVGWDFSSTVEGGDNDPTDMHGHGTHCAGIVAAVIGNATGVTGVVPTARVMALKCHPALTISNLIKGVVYAADNGADVINMSWGTWFDWPGLEEVMDYARSRGVILVASAGNDGGEVYNYPASYSQTICVSATNSDDLVTTWSTVSSFVNVSAPGQSILSLRAEYTDMYDEKGEPDVHIVDSSYYLASGTSMSGPVVVAVAAYLRSLSPGLTHDAAKQIMETTADDIVDPYGQGDNYPGWDKYSGYGRVNLAGALAAAPLVRAAIDSPHQGEVVSGSVEVHGSADGTDFTGYILEYGSGYAPSTWTEIISSSLPVTAGVLGSWDASGLEGLYTVRLQVGANVSRINVFVTDSVLVELTSPTPYDTAFGLIQIAGSMACPDFSHALLEYGLGPDPGDWTVIDTLSKMAYDETLLNWGLGDLTPQEYYTLRLSVYSTAGLLGSDSVLVFYTSVFAGESGWMVSLDTTPGWHVSFGDFDDDGQNEIVVGTAVGVQFFSTDGSLKTTGMPAFPPDDYRIPMAVGNLDGDGVDDIVALGLNGTGTIYGFPSAAPPFQLVPETHPVSDYAGHKLNHPCIYLKDINGDGVDEVHYFPAWTLAQSSPSYHYIYRSDGSAWGGNFPLAPEYSRCFPADLDGNGIDEIYCYCDSSHFLVQFDTLGAATDSILIELDSCGFAESQFDFSAVDIDSDNRHELIMAGAFVDNSLLSWRHFWAFDAGLNVVSGWPHFIEHFSWFSPSYSALAFGDLNDDGQLEYLIAGAPENASTIRAWNLDGSSFLGGADSIGDFARPLNPGPPGELMIADLDGDGGSEVLVGFGPYTSLFGEGYPFERVLAFNHLAEVLPGFPANVASGERVTVDGCPTVGDINQDGYVDFVFPSLYRLAFANLAGNAYAANKAYRPMWGYNRRLNHTARLLGGIVVVCGDVNADGLGPDVADLVFLVGYLFLNGATPPVMAMANVDGITGPGGRVDVADLTYMVAYLFQTGPSPVCE